MFDTESLNIELLINNLQWFTLYLYLTYECHYHSCYDIILMILVFNNLQCSLPTNRINVIYIKNNNNQINSNNIRISSNYYS